MSAATDSAHGSDAAGRQEELSFRFAQLVMQQSNMAMMFLGKVAHPESVLEIRAISSLGAIPLVVIARDPALGSVTPDVGGDWQLIQRQKMQLSKNVELVIATGSGHDVPYARPDVIIAAVRKLVSQASGTGGHPGNSLR